MTDVRYSICATHYNNADHIENSAGVFAGLIEGRDDWELVIADAGSDDGSLEYLKRLENERENVRVLLREGINIGEGRRLAAEAARGDVLIQVMDLDANYYRDSRLVETTAFYERLLDREGEVMLSAGVNFCTKSLLAELGGWNDLIANEETELKRRALRRGRLRFCPIRMFDRNRGLEKGLPARTERFYHNSAAKFQAGVGLGHMVRYWLRNAPGLLPKLGALVVFPLAWLSAERSGVRIENSYRRNDRYVMDFKRSVYEHRPELWLESPEELSAYVDETEVTAG